MSYVPNSNVLEVMAAIRQDPRLKDGLREAIAGEVAELKNSLIYDCPEEDVHGIRQSIKFLETLADDLLKDGGHYDAMARDRKNDDEDDEKEKSNQ